MVQNTNFSNGNQNHCVQYTNDSTSLLSKYDLPITHLDFSYVEKCADAKELEKIYHVLISGQEGYYPELTETVEKKLQILYPSSKFLRKHSKVIFREDLDRDEWTVLSNDLTEWVSDISKNDKELVQKKKFQGGNSEVTEPEIRQIQTVITEENNKNDTIKKRISSTDYASWDKYDPDTEILKMNLEEEKLNTEALQEEKITKKQVKFNKFCTQAEAIFEAKREKEKGNEYFKTREYDSALIHYTSSLECNVTIECLNNRALTYIKMKKYQKALQDLDAALAIEPHNYKSTFRKVLALEGLSKFENALNWVEKCIRMDPNDTNVQTLAEKIRKNCACNVSERRLAIEETQSDDLTNEIRKTKKNRNGILKNKVENKQSLQDEIKNKENVAIYNTNRQYFDNSNGKQHNNSKVIVPIPGTSKMTEPFYVTCDLEDIQYTMVQIHNSTQKTNFIAKISLEEDECSVDHFEQITSKITESESDGENEKPKIRRQHKMPANQQEELILNDKEAGGEPCRSTTNSLPGSIYSPYTFLKTWNSIGDDPTLRKYAFLIKNMNMNQLVQVIGCKLDNEMFSIILKTLYRHFTVPGEVEKIYSVLTNVSRLPRFEIIAMLMSNQDKNCVQMLISFLNQHDKPLPRTVAKAFA